MGRAHATVLEGLGRTVRARRQALGWTRRDLSRGAAISERFLADVEHGLANPSVSRLCDLAAALGTTPDALLRAAASGGDEPPVIALLGLRGAGKSTVGAALAERLGLPFIELDGRVEERSGLRLGELFELHGERYYRREEQAALREVLAGGTPAVLAVGGGLVTEPESFDLLRSGARTVWLHADPADHWHRVLAQGDTRPMADNEHAYHEMCALLGERERLYCRSDRTVETSGRTVDEIVDELANRCAAPPAVE